MSHSDVIDQLAGVRPGSPVDAIRARRPQARANAERSYRELFPAAALDLSYRLAVAAFVASLHRSETVGRHYASLLEAQADAARLPEAVAAAAASAATSGPYGRFASAELRSEDVEGLKWRLDAAPRAALGEKLAAALEHAHALVFHPRDAAPEALGALLAAGHSTTEIVTLSQLVAFLAFQIRVVEGLRALAA